MSRPFTFTIPVPILFKLCSNSDVFCSSKLTTAISYKIDYSGGNLSAFV